MVVLMGQEFNYTEGHSKAKNKHSKAFNAGKILRRYALFTSSFMKVINMINFDISKCA